MDCSYKQLLSAMPLYKYRRLATSSKAHKMMQCSQRQSLCFLPVPEQAQKCS